VRNFGCGRRKCGGLPLCWSDGKRCVLSHTDQHRDHKRDHNHRRGLGSTREAACRSAARSSAEQAASAGLLYQRHDMSAKSCSDRNPRPPTGLGAALAAIFVAVALTNRIVRAVPAGRAGEREDAPRDQHRVSSERICRRASGTSSLRYRSMRRLREVRNGFARKAWRTTAGADAGSRINAAGSANHFHWQSGIGRASSPRSRQIRGTEELDPVCRGSR